MDLKIGDLIKLPSLYGEVATFEVLHVDVSSRLITFRNLPGNSKLFSESRLFQFNYLLTDLFIEKVEKEKLTIKLSDLV